MAENASTVFYVSVPKFVKSIWFALRDPEEKVREHAVEALRACLRVIELRETRWRGQWLVPSFDIMPVPFSAQTHVMWFLSYMEFQLAQSTLEFFFSKSG